MTVNAMFWVRYTDANHPNQGVQMISLMSPDLVNTKEAHRRAKATAKTRLAKRGVKATGLNSQCVG